jgi:hypothetical protein
MRRSLLRARHTSSIDCCLVPKPQYWVRESCRASSAIASSARARVARVARALEKNKCRACVHHQKNAYIKTQVHSMLSSASATNACNDSTCKSACRAQHSLHRVHVRAQPQQHIHSINHLQSINQSLCARDTATLTNGDEWMLRGGVHCTHVKQHVLRTNEMR